MTNEDLILSKLDRISENLDRIATAQEKLAMANVEFQRVIVAAFTPLVPAMLAMFSVPKLPGVPVTVKDGIVNG